MATKSQLARYGFSKRWLDAHPQVKAVLNKAVNKDWTAEETLVRIKETDWYRKSTIAQREWSKIVIEQPAEAQQQIDDARRRIESTAGLIGVKLTNKEERALALRAAKNQWDESDYRLFVSQKIGRGDLNKGTGDIDNMVRQVQQWSEEYLVRTTPQQRLKWAKQLARNDMQLEDLQVVLQRKAIKQYGAIADDLRAGETTMSVMAPYLQDAAEELGVTAATLDAWKPKWTAAIEGKDGKAFTREEWLKKIRTEQQYGYDQTRKARNEAAGIGDSVLRLFGMR
jgi:hypothetical protein